MELDPGKVAAELSQLIPGFLTAWIYYSLTAHSKPSPFERVIQALIFTIIIQALIVPVRGSLLLVGQFFSLGRWNNEARLVWSVLFACVVGLVSSRLTNNDRLHGLLRRQGWTTRTASPSEWFSAFATNPSWGS